MGKKGTSFRHGTVEGYTTHKCNCVNCESAYRESIGQPPIDIPRQKEPMLDNTLTPDIVLFLHSGKFNSITVDILNGEWVAAIKAHGDRYLGYGVTPDYALFAAIKRYHSTDPVTGPITVTVNQSTRETSQGNGLDSTGEIALDNIWPTDSDSISGNQE